MKNILYVFVSLLLTYTNKVFPMIVIFRFFTVPADAPQSAMRDQRLWSLQECADIFTTCLDTLKAEFAKQGEGGMLVWDKVQKNC